MQKEDGNKENMPIEVKILDIEIEQEGKMLEFDKVLKKIEQTGRTNLQWTDMKMNFIEKYKEVMMNYFPIENEEPAKDDDNDRIDKVNNIDEDIIEYITNLNKMPFTLQRMAELLLSPNKYYKIGDKYNSAFKKLVNIDTD